MTSKPISAVLFILLLSSTFFAQTTEISYQGQLKSSSATANGNFDFEFLLFDLLTDGSQVGPTLTRSSVVVTNGIFSVKLDFGSNFPGASRFLEIHVRQTGGGQSFTTLAPRQQVNSAPYSVKSISADSATTATNATTDVNFSGSLAGDVTGTQGSTAIANSAVTAAKIAPGQVVKSVNGLSDGVTLAGDGTITVTPTGNTLTIASTITQSAAGVQLPANVQLAPTGPQGAGQTLHQVQFGSPNGETGMTISGTDGRADLRFNGSTLKLAAGPGNGNPPPSANGITITSGGLVSIGVTDPNSITAARISVSGTGDSACSVAVIAYGNPLGRTCTNVLALTTTDSTIRLIDGFGPSGSTVFGVDASGIVTSRSLQTTVKMGAAGAYGYIAAFDGLSGPRDMVIGTAGGNVGIGTIFPNRTLDVYGRARINSIPLEASFANVCFNFAGDLLQCGASSLRWKTNVHKYSDGLNILRKLNPISYNWKEGGAYDIGLGAEDVAKAAPFFAFRNKEGVVEGVRYERVNMVLINAVKEQQSQIELQQKQIDLQARQIERLTKTVDSIRSQVRRGRKVGR